MEHGHRNSGFTHWNMVILHSYNLVGGLEHEFYDFPYIGNSNPNWRTPSFFRGVGIPPTSTLNSIAERMAMSDIGFNSYAKKK